MRRSVSLPVAPPLAQRYGESAAEPKHGNNWADIAASASESGFARASLQPPTPQPHQAKYQLHIATVVEKNCFGGNNDGR